MLIFVVVVSFSEFSGKLSSLTVLLFTADYGKTRRGRGHIVSPRAQLVYSKCSRSMIRVSS